ncbi:hypothetical protein halTADL_1292 [Halohasta litchfieldiae]|uniref:Uncharacterized protein n=1 Tax=Halorubrum lacusprofundi (strain ATCC 49239 / DSM 5036 / JCM 8891 / ACAM 34) TaxID=416348 RepID=B9LWL7_HALLT|nr:hypothetical protein [Halorubrum lacusprofundi]ACM58858.1 hypothetical protein Hlac_3337 [Halorubrum lacusprofundi ATCC 49239]ATW88070.1 hypothetical protein halTADL_1292 [Halohasta litchfieldiae]
MTNDTLTDGLTNDRYVKAVRLVDDFEDEVYDRIKDTLDDIMTSEQEGLFDNNLDYDKGHNPTPGPTYGTLRFEGTMMQTNSDGNNLKLNIGLEWVEPETQGRDEWPEPLLCYVYYKIKYAPTEPFQAVSAATRESNEWDAISVGDEQWDSGQRVAPGIFYVPIVDGDDIEEGLSVLGDHCTTFVQQMVE